MTLRSTAVATVLATFTLVGSPAFAQAQAGPFDGAWNVTMTCPPHNEADDDAKGYTHRFVAEVQKSRMRGTHGKEGEPGWHFLHGKINDDGSATLRLDGIVNNPRFAINDAQRGKKYSYRIKAQFEPGQRRRPAPDGRACEFRFTR